MCPYLPKCLMMDIQKLSVQYRLLKGLALICCIKDCRTAKSDFLLVQQYKAWTFKTFVLFGDLCVFLLKKL